MQSRKQPLGGKSYGSIGHLPGSRMGPKDRQCPEGHKRIATEKARDKFDSIQCQEKLDGSCVSVARIGDILYPLTRAGYIASCSEFQHHHIFAEWVYTNQQRFLAVLKDGERLCGEWLIQAHGTRYDLPHEPFVVFDLMRANERATVADLTIRVKNYGFVQPRLLHIGGPFSIEAALEEIATSGHGALDPVEGAVWRVERHEKIEQCNSRGWKVDFLVKYVRPEKQDISIRSDMNGVKEPRWNSFINGPILPHKIAIGVSIT